MLGCYFRSGWAFLVPYVVTYVLYAWLKWPVHSTSSAGETGQLSHGFPIPLLHIYWTLHFLHLVGGTIALRSWWSNNMRSGSQSTAELLCPLVPWVFLALVFWIPGVYLEFPADPWQHYARTTEWGWHGLVTQHTTWTKSSYFLAYSFIGHITPPLRQLRGFDVYYTACCLLLCWQYYRLARAIGFSERASLMFVLLQTLLFGNNLFGFYRYYGMSSSVFAQIGAVAATRLALEVFGAGILRESKRNDRPPASSLSDSLTPATPGRLLPSLSEILKFGVALAGLLPVIAFNHVQGLMIATIGIGAVALWRLVAWRRAMIGWLALGAVALSVAAILWLPKHPLLDQSYRPGGWMTAWYGFNLVVPSSPGFQRAWVMIGAFGGINLAAALWLLRRNHVAGWLTLMPLLALCHPLAAIPFGNELARHGDYVVTFHRPLLAIPAGLALVALAVQCRTQLRGPLSMDEKGSPQLAPLATAHRGAATFAPRVASASPFPLLLALLCAALLLPERRPFFNRLFNSLMVPADDLMVRAVNGKPALDRLRTAQRGLAQASLPLRRRIPASDPRILPWLKTSDAEKEIGPVLLTSQGFGYAAVARNIGTATFCDKRLGLPPSTAIHWLSRGIGDTARRGRKALFMMPRGIALWSPYSLTGQVSGHWHAHQVALECAGSRESSEAARLAGGSPLRSDADAVCYLLGPWGAPPPSNP